MFQSDSPFRLKRVKCNLAFNIMLARNIATGVLLHIILRCGSLSTRAFLIELLRIVCYLTLRRLRRNSHIKIAVLPIVRRMLMLCMPKPDGTCVQLSDGVLTLKTQSNLYVACQSPLLLASGAGYITVQTKMTHVRMNGINVPEAFWARLFAYYMPKTVVIGRLVLDVTVARVTKRTMKFTFRGPVSTWTGEEPLAAYMRLTSSTVELFSIPDIVNIQ